MCLVNLIIDGHSNYPFIFVMNRDELYDRSATPIHRWTDYPDVTAGVDLEELGTWLGYKKDGKFIAVLNHPSAEWMKKLNQPRSRGKLLKDYLTTDIATSDFEKQLKETRTSYNGYHLIFGTFEQLKYYSNIEDKLQELTPGLHTLSNTTDDLSNHRVNYSCKLLENYMSNHIDNIDLDGLIKVMQDEKLSAKMENFPKMLDYETAKRHSSIFIKGEDFGTVGTTAILLDKKGNLKVKEVKYNRETVTEQTTLEQKLD